MKKIQLQITIQLFDKYDDKVAQFEGNALKPLLDKIKDIKYSYGKVRLRVTYDPDKKFYNEATFESATQAKVLAQVFREKAIWDFIRGAS